MKFKYLLPASLMALMLAGCQQNPPVQPVVVTQPPAGSATSEKTTTTNTETKVETPQTPANPDGTVQTKTQQTTTVEQKKQQ